MTDKEYRRYNEDYFKGKKVVTKRQLFNRKGEHILKNEICTITRKYKGFEIRNASRIWIGRVSPQDVEFYNDKTE